VTGLYATIITATFCCLTAEPSGNDTESCERDRRMKLAPFLSGFEVEDDLGLEPRKIGYLTKEKCIALKGLCWDSK
jgi:hypothetical protein